MDVARRANNKLILLEIRNLMREARSANQKKKREFLFFYFLFFIFLREDKIRDIFVVDKLGETNSIPDIFVGVNAGETFS